MTATIGRIVHYVNEGLAIRPAIVVEDFGASEPGVAALATRTLPGPATLSGRWPYGSAVTFQLEKTAVHSVSAYAAPFASCGAKVNQAWRSWSMPSAVKSRVTRQVTAELPPASCAIAVIPRPPVAYP